MRSTSQLYPAAGLVGLVILACSGCHTIFPFDREEVEAGVELGVTDASIDAPLADAALSDQAASDHALPDQAAPDVQTPDLPAPDLPAPDLPADLPAPDLPAPDLPAPDQAVPDAALPDACWPGPPPPTATACVDPEGAATNGCNACPPADDVDCDGLKGSTHQQDPWPWTRNPLLVADGFKGLLSRWTSKGSVTLDSSAGLVTLPKQSTITLSKATCTAALPNPDYLTEVKLSVDAHGTGARIFQLFTALAAPVHRMCRISGTTTDVTLKVEVRTSTTSSVSESKTTGSFGVTVGTAMILQSWGDKSTGVHVHHCRLLTSDGKTKLVHVEKTQALSLPGTVMLGGDSATYLLDYVRVYKQ